MGKIGVDTHPKMEALQIQMLKQATPIQKLEMMSELNASARLLVLAGLRARYPQAGEPELHRRLAGMLLGEELACKVYGDLNNAT